MSIVTTIILILIFGFAAWVLGYRQGKRGLPMFKFPPKL